MSMEKNKFFDSFEKVPIVGILRGYSTDNILRIAEAFAKADMTTLEVTMNTPDVLTAIKSLREQYPTLNIGAGTVCNVDDLNRAIDAGAQYIVTPILKEDVIINAVNLDIPIFPGAYTPSEIYHAWSLGASAVKVFPAGQLGVQYIKDVLAPLDMLQLIPTGGVNISNIYSFFEAGAYGVGLGGSLFDKQLIGSQNFKGLKEHIVRMREAMMYR